MFSTGHTCGFHGSVTWDLGADRCQPGPCCSLPWHRSQMAGRLCPGCLSLPSAWTASLCFWVWVAPLQASSTVRGLVLWPWAPGTGQSCSPACTMSHLDRSSQWSYSLLWSVGQGREAWGGPWANWSWPGWHPGGSTSPRGHLNHPALRAGPSGRTQVLADKEPASVSNKAAKTNRREARTGSPRVPVPRGDVEAAVRGGVSWAASPLLVGTGIGVSRVRVWMRPSTSLECSLQTYFAKITPKHFFFLLVKKCGNTPQTQRGDCSVNWGLQ